MIINFILLNLFLIAFHWILIIFTFLKHMQQKNEMRIKKEF